MLRSSYFPARRSSAGWCGLVLLMIGGTYSIAEPVSPPVAEARFQLPPGFLAYYESPQLDSVAGNPLLLRRDTAGRLLIERLANGEQQVLGPATEEGKITAPRFRVQEGRVYVWWHEQLGQDGDLGKAEEKVMLLRVSDEGGTRFEPPRRLTREGRALPVAELEVTAGGDLYVISLERRDKKNSDLYVDVARDYGKDWGTAGQRINVPGEGITQARESRILARDETVWIVWWERAAGRNTLNLSRSRDRGLTWSEPEAFHTLAISPAGLQFLGSGERLLVYWLAGSTIRGLVSIDEGQSWRALESMPGKEVKGYGARADADGVVHLFFTRAIGTEKPDVYYARAEDGIDFSDPVRLSTSNPPHMSTSDLPAIAVNEQAKQVLVLWQDLRRLRPIIYGNVSLDGGQTWRSHDFPVGEASGEKVALYPRPTALGDGRFMAGWLEYPDIRMRQAEAVVMPITPAELPESPPPKPDLERLKQRVQEYWQARLAADWAKTFDYYDPFYRSRTNRPAHATQRGTVVYYDYVIKAMEPITPWRVNVKLQYESEVPRLLIGGKIRSIPRDKHNMEQEWIWIDEEWFLVFRDVFGNPIVSY